LGLGGRTKSAREPFGHEGMGPIESWGLRRHFCLFYYIRQCFALTTSRYRLVV
jgi:hypothetical protein